MDDEISYLPPDPNVWAREACERIDKLTRELCGHENRLIETYCEMFEEHGLYHLICQNDPEPGVMRRTTLATMFGKPLARVDVTYSLENHTFTVIPYRAF
jgi:hypothetical protein